MGTPTQSLLASVTDRGVGGRVSYRPYATVCPYKQLTSFLTSYMLIQLPVCPHRVPEPTYRITPGLPRTPSPLPSSLSPPPSLAGGAGPSGPQVVNARLHPVVVVVRLPEFEEVQGGYPEVGTVEVEVGDDDQDFPCTLHVRDRR